MLQMRSKSNDILRDVLFALHPLHLLRVHRVIDLCSIGKTLRVYHLHRYAATLAGFGQVHDVGFLKVYKLGEPPR